MTGVEVVVAALAAGAGAGTGEAAKAAVVDAYAGLRDALRRRLRGQTGIEDALDGVQAEPGETRVDLVAALSLSLTCRLRQCDPWSIMGAALA
jgi:hypothetical protein